MAPIHAGTHIDALAHFSADGLLYGGISAEAAQQGGVMNQLGIDTMAPLVCRGVLLDVAGTLGVDVLPPGHGITIAELEDACEYGSVTPEKNDAVLIRTGWAVHFDDRRAFLGGPDGLPGVGHDGAVWLADRGVTLCGSDTHAFEQIPSPWEGTAPVHVELLVRRGIYIVECLKLEELSKQRVFEFVFFLAPLKIVGGTGSHVRPVAVVSSTQR